MTRQSDYGILLLAHVARAPIGAVRAASMLASETGVPVAMVSKILKELARADLLESHRGVKGGYSLARRPDEISVGDIVTALEGPIAMTACVSSSEENCDLQPHCCVQANWQVLNRVVISTLSRVSLAEMARPLPQELVQLETGREAGRPGCATCR